jgi:hypothetical protein
VVADCAIDGQGLRGKNRTAMSLQIQKINDLKQKIGRKEPLNDEEKAFMKAVSM